MLFFISFSVFERKFTLFSANSHRFALIIGFFYKKGWKIQVRLFSLKSFSLKLNSFQ